MKGQIWRVRKLCNSGLYREQQTRELEQTFIERGCWTKGLAGYRTRQTRRDDALGVMQIERETGVRPQEWWGIPEKQKHVLMMTRDVVG